jgi:hypothetical protein
VEGMFSCILNILFTLNFFSLLVSFSCTSITFHFCENNSWFSFCNYTCKRFQLQLTQMTSDSLQAHEPIMAENYFYFMVLCLNKLINFHDTFQYGNVINFHLIARCWNESICLLARLHMLFKLTFIVAC